MTWFSNGTSLSTLTTWKEATLALTIVYLPLLFGHIEFIHFINARSHGSKKRHQNYQLEAKFGNSIFWPKTLCWLILDSNWHYRECLLKLIIFSISCGHKQKNFLFFSLVERVIPGSTTKLWLRLHWSFYVKPNCLQYAHGSNFANSSQGYCNHYFFRVFIGVLLKWNNPNNYIVWLTGGVDGFGRQSLSLITIPNT